MKRRFTIQAIGVLIILWGGSLDAAILPAQDREPTTVAPGTDVITDAEIAVGELRFGVRALGHPASSAEASCSRARKRRLMMVPVRVRSARAASL